MGSASGVGRGGFQPTEERRRSGRRKPAPGSITEKIQEAAGRTPTEKPAKGKKPGLGPGRGITKQTAAPPVTRVVSAALLPSPERLAGVPAARRSLYDVARGVMRAYLNISQLQGLTIQTTRAWEFLKQHIKVPTRRELAVQAFKTITTAAVTFTINKYYNVNPNATSLLINSVRLIDSIGGR